MEDNKILDENNNNIKMMENATSSITIIDERDTILDNGEDERDDLNMMYKENDEEEKMEKILQLMIEISDEMSDKLLDKDVQLKGIQAYVSLLTAVPGYNILKKKKILTKTKGVKRVLRAMMSHPHYKLLIYEGLVFISHCSVLSRKLKESLLANSALKLCTKCVVEWYKQFVIVTSGLGAIFHLIHNSPIGINKLERLDGAQVLLSQLLQYYGNHNTAGESANDILEWVFNIITLFKNKRTRYEGLLTLILDYLSHFNDKNTNCNYKVLTKAYNAIGNLTYRHHSNRKLVIKKGIVQIITSSLYNQFNLDASIASIIVLNNLSQSREALIENLRIGDGDRTITLVIETMKIVDFQMNSAALNFLAVVCLNDELRNISLKHGALQLIDTDNFKNRFVEEKTRDRYKHKKFQERINRCIKILLIQTEEELKLLESQLLAEKEEESKKYYIEEFTGRRMLIGLTGKLSPKHSSSNGSIRSPKSYHSNSSGEEEEEEEV